MRSPSRPPSLRLLICLPLAALLFASCATPPPAGKYQALADASQTTLAATTGTYTRIERLQQRYLITRLLPEEELTTNSFKLPPTLDLTPELRFREAALEVLASYTTVLGAFAQRDFGEGIDVACEKLGASVKSLAGTAGSERLGDVSGMFASVINVVGREIVKRQQRRALRSVMISAAPDVQKLCSLLAGSNDKVRQAVDVMAGQVFRNAVRSRPRGATFEQTDLVARARFDTELTGFVAEMDDIRASLEALNGALAQISPAHAEILKRLDEPAAPLDSLRQFIAEAQRANRFYRTVK